MGRPISQRFLGLSKQKSRRNAPHFKRRLTFEGLEQRQMLDAGLAATLAAAGSEIGVHRAVGNAGYFIQDPNGNGYWDGGDRFFSFGYDHDTPIIGDWNGDGKDQIGVHRAVGNAGYFIQDYNGNGYWDGGDRFFIFGYASDTPIIGDWNGDGKDQIGVHRAVGNAGYFIQEYNDNGYWDGGDRFFIFGYGYDTPIIGDWNGDGKDQIGVHRAVGGAGYFIQEYNGNGYWDGGDRFFIFGYNHDTPIIGDWNGNGKDQIGVHRAVGNAGYFIQEYNDNGYWDGGDRFFDFGYGTDTPLVGNWLGAVGELASGFESRLIIPAAVAEGNSRTIYVEYSNQGTTSIAAPLLMIGPSTPSSSHLFTLDSSLAYSTSSEGYSSSAQILASGQNAGLLNPGESITVPVYFYSDGIPASSLTFSLLSYDQDNTSDVGWSSLQASLQPSGMSAEAWNALFTSFKTQVGSTWGDYVTMLNDNASYLGQLGENITDASQLWKFSLAQADGLTPTPVLSAVTDLSVTTPALNLHFSRIYNESLSSRNTFGPLGYGWRHSWQYSLAQLSGDAITVTMPSGAQRNFAATGGTGTSGNTTWYYYSASNPGDHATVAVTYISGSLQGFWLTEPDGQYTWFNANGTLSALYAPGLKNGIFARYTNGQLTSLSQSSSGESLTINYEPTGLISSVASSDGRTVNYYYVSSGHLTFANSYDGQYTTYSYDNSSNATTRNSLTRIHPPSEPNTYFYYSTSTGHLSSTAVADDSWQNSLVTYYGRSSHSGSLGVISADTLTTYYFDSRGRLVETIDPSRNASSATYDSNNNLLTVTGPTNLTNAFNYDRGGNLLSATDTLGQTVTFTYGSKNRMTSITDAEGNTTSYAYDTYGNLTSTTNPSGAVKTVAYDAQGNPVTLLNPNGQPVTYTYNSAGQVTRRTLADGSVSTFAYDPRGNLATATDATGTIALAYDSGDRLTSVSYPNGQFLAYTYDSAGWRTQMVDQTGFAVNYAYDSLGRLSTLFDGTGAIIIGYNYNSLGQLSRQHKGNGTYTTFQYDADGRVLHLLNYSPTNSIDSRFDYTYNALGEQTSMTTLDGTWNYGYDQLGQLTTAVFASTNPAVPSQNLAYSYDVNGNRTGTVVNGVTTTYATNNLNQYTTVGNTTYQYDTDGNLISTTTGSVTTIYTYDSLNRLVRMTSPTDTWTYTYNALNDRASTTHNGQVTTNLVDPTGLGNVVGTYDGSGILVANYTYGLGLVSQVSAWSKDYYDFNALGSTVGLTSTSGTVVNTYGYLPFGGTLSSSAAVANPFTFVGQFGVTTDGNGLMNMRARYYDAVAGRFVSEDPLGLGGGQISFYNYAYNSPTTYIDPSGLQGDKTPTFWSTTKDAFGHIFKSNRPAPTQEEIDHKRNINNLAATAVLGLMQGTPKAVSFIKGLATCSPPDEVLHSDHLDYVTRDPFQAAGTAVCRNLLNTTPSHTPPPTSTGEPDSKTDYDASGEEVNSTAAITASPSALRITAAANSSSASATFSVTNSGPEGSTLVYTLQPYFSAGQITFSKQPSNLGSGQSDTYTVTVTVPGNFQAGQTYSGTIVISSTDPNVADVSVPVNVTVESAAAAVTANPNPLNITATANAASATASLTVKNTGETGSTLVYSLQGSLNGGTISISPSQGNLNYNQSTTHTVTVTKSGNFQAGQTYYGTITISSTDPRVSSVQVPVTVTVQEAPAAEIYVSPSSLTFTATQGTNPPSVSLTVGNTGPAGSVLEWSMETTSNRLTHSGNIVPLPSGYSTTITENCNTSDLAPGNHTATLRIVSSDPRVAAKTISVHITITGQPLPTWGAFESGSNGRASDQWYSISSSQMTIRFWMQPFVLADRFIVSDESGKVYVNAQFSTEDNDDNIPIQRQNPRYVDFTKPAGVTRLRVQVIPNSDSNTGWWYHGVLPGQLWY